MKKESQKDINKENRVEKKIGLKIPYSLITGDTNIILTGFTTDTGIDYYTKETFLEKFKVLSPSTIQRRIEDLEYHPAKHRYYIKLNGNIYLTCGIVGFKTKDMRNFKNRDYSQFLSLYTWDLNGTVNYPTYTSIEGCRKKMENLFNSLKRKYPEASLRFFYVTEKCNNEDGYHSHFTLGFKNAAKNEEVKNYIENRLRAKNTDAPANTKITNNKVGDGWLEYTVKQIDKIKDGYGWRDNGLN